MKAARRATAPVPRDYRAIWKSGARHLHARARHSLEEQKRLLNKLVLAEREIERLREELKTTSAQAAL